MTRQIITAVALALSAVACARLSGSSKDDRSVGQPRPGSIVVNVLNENYYDARIHAVYSGAPRRSLGTIAGNGGRTRSVLNWEPRSLVFEVLFVTDGSAFVSLPVDVAVGDSVDVRVPSNISESGFFRRVMRR